MYFLWYQLEILIRYILTCSYSNYYWNKNFSFNSTSQILTKETLQIFRTLIHKYLDTLPISISTLRQSTQHPQSSQYPRSSLAQLRSSSLVKRAERTKTFHSAAAGRRYRTAYTTFSDKGVTKSNVTESFNPSIYDPYRPPPHHAFWVTYACTKDTEHLVVHACGRVDPCMCVCVCIQCTRGQTHRIHRRQRTRQRAGCHMVFHEGEGEQKGREDGRR